MHRLQFDENELRARSLESLNKTYFGFAIADSMFPANCELRKVNLTPDQAKKMFAEAEIVSCVNPSHAETIKALKFRFGILVDVPARPPIVSLKSGDSVIVMGVRGLPRLTDRHEYTEKEIENATFVFSKYTVLYPEPSPSFM